MEGMEIPPYFLCPISLQIMRDPVTICTGITYDREFIERWIYSDKNNTCPVTKQALPDSNLTPNHTLRRLIQAWSIVNASNGVERIPTPKPPVDKDQIAKLLNEAKLSHLQLKSLQKIKSLALESEMNKRCIEASGAVDFLASLVKNTSTSSTEETLMDCFEFARASDEALVILYSLQISKETLQDLISKNSDFIESLTKIVQRGNYQSLVYAILLLKSIFEVADPVCLTSMREDVFRELLLVLRDQISPQATKAVLKILIELCPWGKNRIKAVDAGAVSVLIELLLETSERRPCELMLVALDFLCGCAEGRSELLKHGAGIAVVSKKILRVSHVASQRGVRILCSISRSSATSSAVKEMLQVGVVSKLCLVIQGDCDMKTKEKAREILNLHSRVWMNSTCIPPHLASLYPSP